MKTLIFVLLPLLTFAQDSYQETYRLQKPALYSQNSLYLRQTGSRRDLRDMVNAWTAAMGYAAATNTIRNGSGNLALLNPLATEGTLTQTLRTLSLFDLHLTHQVKLKEKHPKFNQAVSMDFVGMSSTRDFLETRPDLLRELDYEGLRRALDVVAPLFSGNIRRLPLNYQNNTAFAIEANEGIRNSLGRHWPLYKPARGDLERLIWLAEGYLPVYGEGRISVVPEYYKHKSTFHSEVNLPLIGELVASNRPPQQWEIRPIVQDLKALGKEIIADPVIIEEISIGKFRRNLDGHKLPVIRMSIDKDYSKVHELDVTLEFGNVDTASRVQTAPLHFDDPEAALVARGHLNVDGFRDIGVRLSFHRIALRLKRPEMSWEESFEKDPNFNSISTIRERSVKTLSLLVPKHRYAIRSAMASAFGWGDCSESTGLCTYVISNYDKWYARAPIKNIVLSILNEKGDNSVDNIIPGALTDGDKLASHLIERFWTRFMSARELLARAIIEVQRSQLSERFQ